MNTTRFDASLNRLYDDLGFQPLSHWWGRVEMVLGLFGMAAGTFGMILISTEILRQTAYQPLVKEDFSFPYLPMIGSFMLFILGGYLTLAGHRRHVYESADRLTAYLADMIRPQTVPAADRPAEPVVATPTPNGPASPAGLQPTGV
jgi:hypothetical protein